MDYSKYYTDGETEEKKDYSQYYGDESVDYSKYYAGGEPAVPEKTNEADEYLKSIEKYRNPAASIKEGLKKTVSDISKAPATYIPQIASGLASLLGMATTNIGEAINKINPFRPSYGSGVRPGGIPDTIGPATKEPLSIANIGQNISDVGETIERKVVDTADLISDRYGIDPREHPEVVSLLRGGGHLTGMTPAFAALGPAALPAIGALEETKEAIRSGEDVISAGFKGGAYGLLNDKVFRGAHKLLPRQWDKVASMLGFGATHEMNKALETGKLSLPNIETGISMLTPLVIPGGKKKVEEKKGPTTVSQTPKIPEPKMPEVAKQEVSKQKKRTEDYAGDIPIHEVNEAQLARLQEGIGVPVERIGGIRVKIGEKEHIFVLDNQSTSEKNDVIRHEKRHAGITNRVAAGHGGLKQAENIVNFIEENPTADPALAQIIGAFREVGYPTKKLANELLAEGVLSMDGASSDLAELKAGRGGIGERFFANRNRNAGPKPPKQETPAPVKLDAATPTTVSQTPKAPEPKVKITTAKEMAEQLAPKFEQKVTEAAPGATSFEEGAGGANVGRNKFIELEKVGENWKPSAPITKEGDLGVGRVTKEGQRQPERITVERNPQTGELVESVSKAPIVDSKILDAVKIAETGGIEKPVSEVSTKETAGEQFKTGKFKMAEPTATKDYAEPFKTKTDEWRNRMQPLYGKRIINAGTEWKLVGNNDLGVPYFSKVVNGQVQKKQFTIDGYGDTWTKKQLSVIEQPDVGGAANIDAFAQPETPINLRVSPAIFDLPEMVSITKELTGKYPRIKKKMKPGRLGQFNQSTKGIDILSKLSSDQFQSKATLAHEIGHLVDYLAETNPNTLKRGNILGRIASLLDHRANIFPESEQTRQALEDMLGRKIDNNYNMEMKKEAKALSFKWRPLGGNTDKKYLGYRNSSKEIYADMISVLLNDPVMLKESAPKFYNNFFGYLDRKPEVKAQYQKIIEDMNSGEHKTNLEKKTIAGFERGDKVRSDIAAAGKGRRGLAANVRAAWAQMATYIEPLLHYQRLAKDINPKSSTDTSARDLLERLLYVGSENDFYLRAYNKETAGLAKTHGIDYNTLRLHALLKEVVSPKQPETFTTQGWTRERARESLEKMENRLGSQKFAILEQARKNYFVKVRKEVLLDTPDFKWMVGEKLSNMFLEREHYVTHSVIDHLEKLVGSERGGASGPQIFKRWGSFAEIEDPYSATILKDLSLIRSVRRSRAANGLREWLGKNLPEKVSDKKGGPLSSEISYMRDGKIEKFYVEEPIARMFEKNPLESVGVTRIMGQLAAPFKASFVSLNLGFYAVNPSRDYARTIQNVEGMTLTNFAKFWFGAIPESIRAVKNKGNTPNVDRMFKENKITATVHQAWNTAGVESERLLSKYQIPVDRGDSELSKFQKRTGIAFGKKVIGKFYEKLTDVLKVQELTTKLAAEKWLVKNKPGMSSDERGHIIRTQAGTPDTLMRGDIGAFLNSAFLFYNVSMQGWRGNMEAARHHPKEWAWKQVKYSIAPKILMAAAAAGILGDDTKKVMAGFSNYLKQNFHIIPIGLTKSGKSVGLSIPMDETQRVVGGLTDMAVNKLFGNKDGRTLNDAIKFAEQQLLPTPNPIFEITSDTLKYFYGEDVVDSFRGGKALSEREKLAGGTRSLGKFTQYEFNKYFSSIKKFNGNSSDEIHTELEKILGIPIIGNPISRYIRITDYGVSEKLGAAQLEEKKSAARKGLAVDDAIKEKIAAGIKTPGQISDTYREFMRDGTIEKNATKYQFQKKFKRFIRGETPLERQLVYATSNNEKVAIINKAKELMGKDELRKLLKDYFEEKLISKDVYNRVR